MSIFNRMREAGAASGAAQLERAGSQAADAEPDADDVVAMNEDDAKQVVCPTCNGDGKVRGGKVTCPDCNGSGKVPANSDAVREAAIALSSAELRRMHESVVELLREAGSLNRSADERDQLASEGKAMPDGSYPIDSTEELGAAIKSVGRGGADHNAIRRHIIKRAAALKASEQVPDNWNGDGSMKESAQVAQLETRLAELEHMVHTADAIREAQPEHLNREFAPMVLKQNSRGQWGYELTLIREGLGNQSDGAWYPGSAIQEMCESGRAEGMQAFSDHPTLEEEEQRPERSIKELIGTHTDVHYVVENGLPKAKSIFVPITTDKADPHYGWVNQLAEAAVRNRGPQPLVGWSLFGLSAGDEGKRPDGSEGRIVSLIIPSSGDMVTNAGAGGEFARKLMMESARRLRRAQPPNQEDEPMQIGTFRTQMAEALKELREAETPEAQQAAVTKVEALQAEAPKIEAAAPPPDSVEALTEAAPKLVGQLRESIRKEAAQDADGLRQQLAESNERLGQAEKLLSGITNVTRLAEAVRSAGITDEVDQRHYIGMAQQRGLTEAEDIKAMVEAEREFDKRREDKLLTSVREAVGSEYPEVDGVLSRSPDDGEPTSTGWGSAMRESGVPLKQEQAA